MSVAEQQFALRYRGRHVPADALWWLAHPDAVAPSGTPPPQRAILDAVAELEADGHDEAARALLDTLAELLAFDRRTALDALQAASLDSPP